MGVLVIFAVAIWCFSGVFSDEGTPTDCSNFPRMNGLVACPRILKPVCGTDDATYSNLCMLCHEKLDLGKDVDKKHDGECTQDFCSMFTPETKMCTMEYRPHCGSDGKTYGNKCEFCIAALKSGDLFLSYFGQCQKE